MNDSEYKQILESANEGIITVNAHYRIILFNQGAENMFGYAASEVLGQPLGMLLPQRYRDSHDAHMRRFAKEPETSRAMNVRGQIRGVRNGGEEFVALGSILKTVSSAGDRHYTVIMRDVSLIMAVADHLRYRVKELEHQNYDLAHTRAKKPSAENLLEQLLRESHSYDPQQRQ